MPRHNRLTFAVAKFAKTSSARPQPKASAAFAPQQRAACPSGGRAGAGETQPDALRRELQEELGICARPERYVASHQREVSQRLIHLHAWLVPTFSGELTAHYHRALVWCTPEEAFTYDLAPADIPLLEAFILLRDARPAD